jgi:regulator of CtrA degradation
VKGPSTTSSEVFRPEQELIAFGTTFVRSEAFKCLFREGMALVEETAAYLDGPGREDAGRLARRAALAYAGESMRLTTRLMQIASWLLVQRALAEGEITAAQAASERARVRLTKPEAISPVQDIDDLPERLRGLIGLSLRLHARILHLDRLIAEAPPVATARSPVLVQQWLIRSAFARRGPRERA